DSSLPRFSTIPRPPRPPPFPYPTLFRSANGLTGQFGATTTLAQLLGAPGSNAAESSLIPAASPPVTFRTGTAAGGVANSTATFRSEEHTSELQSRFDLVCRLLLEKKIHRPADACSEFAGHHDALMTAMCVARSN